MATHKVKTNTVAQLWDKPEAGRTNKGQLQAGTLVTVSVSKSVDNILYHQLVSHDNWWSKASWFESLPTPPPPPPPDPPPLNDYIEHVTTDAYGVVTRKKYIPEP